MNAVGIVSIALGVLFVCVRGYSLVAPVPTLRWFRTMARTNGGLRKSGTFVLLVGLTMIWAGSSEDSGLASVLSFLGFAFVGMSTLLLLLFPSAFRALVDLMMPEDTSGVLTFLRFKSITGIIIGALFIYFGVHAL